jgi:predicted MFS family arabinose efflux permease
VKHLVNFFGQRGLSIVGASFMAVCFLVMAGGPAGWMTPFVVAVMGLGFYMFHNTLQTTATQMSPEARGTAIAIFSAALYLGQTLGVAVAAPIIDRYSVVPLYVVTAGLLVALGLWFAHKLSARQSAGL